MLRIYLNISVKKKATNKAKQKWANSVFSSSVTPRITLQLFVCLCVCVVFCCCFFCCFFSTQSKKGKSLNFLCLINDVSFPRAYSDIDHKLKLRITATGGSLLTNTKRFRFTYLNHMEGGVHINRRNQLHHSIRCIIVHRKILKIIFKSKLINIFNHSPECCTWNTTITLQSSK